MWSPLTRSATVNGPLVTVGLVASDDCFTSAAAIDPKTSFGRQVNWASTNRETMEAAALRNVTLKVIGSTAVALTKPMGSFAVASGKPRLVAAGLEKRL